MGHNKLNVVFLHPDLGIGGAERLVVDAATALKQKGHAVKIITAHHDNEHCFQETRDGTLEVISRGDFLPRHIFGKCYALCAYIRMIYIAVYLAFWSGIPVDVVFCDQISACIPVLKLKKIKVLFYCHFPDQLLTKRESLAKKLYRIPLDWFEDITTSWADLIVVNSMFTASVYKKAFSHSKKDPLVLYPSFSPPGGLPDLISPELESVVSNKTVILSLNRYERKKNVKLALECFGLLKDKVSLDVWSNLRLVIAGGYDVRVNENIEYLEELKLLSHELNIKDHMFFLTSIGDQDKIQLLKKASVLLYTPSNEHFGIVPLEAGYYETPVVAVNNGGPTESILDGVTGYLCPQVAEDFALAVQKIICDETESRKMGLAARERIVSHFSFLSFSDRLDLLVNDTYQYKDL